MNKILLSTFVLIFSANTYAELTKQQRERAVERLDDRRLQSEYEMKEPERPKVSTSQSAAAAKENSISMSKEELAKHPDLVIRALIPAVMQRNADNVALLFPIYQQIPPAFHDPLLTKWAEAILAKKAENYSQSIRLYRELVAAKPEILEARLQLAITLFENSELDAAEGQFKKLRSEPYPVIQQISDDYLNAIQKRDHWSFNGGLTYLNDPNINNAPKAGTTYGNWTPPKSESAQGVGFNFNIGKKWSWGNGFFNELRLDTNGKYYWNNKKYNEMSLRGSLGLGYQNAKSVFVVLPFMEQTLYAGGSSTNETLKRFSKNRGATAEFNYWLSPKWQLNANYEYGEQRYVARKHLNGNYHFVSTSLVYLASAKQYWFGGVNYNRTSTRDADDSFLRRGVSLGWGQEWGKGLSTRISLSAAQKNYKGPMPIFNITQRNKEYGITSSIWHRAIHYWGITPRLTYSFTKTKSNHSFYTYDKHRVFIDLSKQF